MSLIGLISILGVQASEAAAIEQNVEDLKKKLEMAEIYAQQVRNLTVYIIVCVYM